MRDWLRRLRGALGMGLSWALVWGVVGGGIMEAFVDPDGRILDMWPQTLAIPGFIGGVVFSVLLGVAERRRRFDELSLARFASLGAATGLLIGGLALGLGAGASLPFWLRLAAIAAPIVVLSTGSAASVLALARLAGRRLSAPAGGGRLGGGDDG
ncbi:MAG: hypothetical protein AB7S39_06790 [Gemmatimonadales bacterium]